MVDRSVNLEGCGIVVPVDLEGHGLENQSPYLEGSGLESQSWDLV